MGIFKKSKITENGIVQKLDEYVCLHNVVLLKMVEVKDQTRSGLYLSQKTKDQINATIEDDMAKQVIKTGPECFYVKPGDFVFLGRETPYFIVLEHEEDGEMVEELYQCVPENWCHSMIRPGVKDAETDAELKKTFDEKVYDKLTFPR